VQALRNREWCATELERAGRPAPSPGPESRRYAPAPTVLLGEKITSTRLAQVSLKVESQWPQFNPSIAAHPDGGFGLVVRSANYELQDAGHYLSLSGDDIIRTTNYLARLAADLQVSSVQTIVQDGVRVRRDARVLGSEDCRLFWWRGGWWLTATRRDQRADGACQMVLGQLDGARLSQLEVLDPGYEDRHEKNWMPFVRGDDLYFVYACYPFTVLRWEPASRTLAEVERTAAPGVMAGLRGGSQGVPLEDGYLFVVHEAHDHCGRRTYSHRFMLMSHQLSPSGLSQPFSFAHDGIEFCAGAARSGDHILMSFGLNDRVAAIAMTSLSGVLSMIEPLC
jgi:hypothetical protein